MIALFQVANESFNAMTDADPDAIWVRFEVHSEAENRSKKELKIDFNMTG